MNLDPGEYNPDSNRNFKATSGKMGFRKANASGTGSFGATSARSMKQGIMGQDVPCPTTYGDVQTMGMAVKANPMRSSAFHSHSKQRPKEANPGLPSPGAYEPNHSSVQPSVRNAAVTMRSKSPRIRAYSFSHAGQEFCTDEKNGPGKYDPDYATGGGRSTIKGKMQRSASFGRSSAFRMSSVRDLTGAYFANEPYF
jgi:hypothetical protein